MQNPFNDSSIIPKIESSLYDLHEQPHTTLIKNNIPFDQVSSVDCNNNAVIAKIKKLKSEWIIFSGGGILRNEILSQGKKFIHVHPGRLPEYRGSTCFYYSMIKEGQCCCSAFIMTENLDSGEIIFQKDFLPPRGIDMDYIFDPWMRSETICDILEKFDFSKNIRQYQNNSEKSEMYYIIHPVLKHLAIQKLDNL